MRGQPNLKNTMFEALAKLDLSGSLVLTIRKVGEEMIVSSFLQSETTDPAAAQLTPLLLRGTPAEIDACFIDQLSQPLKTRNGLLIDMVAFEKQQTIAKAQSQQAAQVATQEKKEKEERKKNFDAALKKVAELEGQNKFREAYTALGEPGNYGLEHTEAAAKKRRELSVKFSTGSLFDEPMPLPVPLPVFQQQTQENPVDENDQQEEADGRDNQQEQDEQEAEHWKEVEDEVAY